jgi:hypothetical protein
MRLMRLVTCITATYATGSITCILRRYRELVLMWRCLVNCEVLESVEPQTGRTALMTAVVFEQRERGLQIEFIRLLLNSSAALHAVDNVSSFFGGMARSICPVELYCPQGGDTAMTLAIDASDEASATMLFEHDPDPSRFEIVPVCDFCERVCAMQSLETFVVLLLATDSCVGARTSGFRWQSRCCGCGSQSI